VRSGKLQAAQVSERLRSQANSQIAGNLSWFFKTGPGEYGEGDKFFGIKVPQVRAVARQFKALPQAEIEKLAMGEYHEERFAALAILVTQYKTAKTPEAKTQLFEFYLHLLKLGRVNNWDLIDSTAPYLGRQLLKMADPMGFLKELAATGDLWQRRAAIMFNFALIAEYELAPTFLIVEELIDHEHDLIHKASGWMLREAGKKDLRALRKFLEKHAATMPRTMLRYAIEKLSKEERADWLSRRSKK
jgi:3-methyladenine DNA glycosylase AlkD